MKNVFIALISTILFLNLNGCSDKKEITNGHETKLKQLKNEISDDLTKNLLPYWSTNMIDTINGGFYGRVEAEEQAYPDADKGGILNTRILWTYSSAFRVLKDSSYFRLATYAKDYILTYFIDKEYGGDSGLSKQTESHPIPGNIS